MTGTDDKPGKKLNLVNVTELIAEEYKDWKHGDYIIIESQTGTGKTYFIETTLIKYLSWASILYVCNRKNLERQIKRDLLIINGKDVPSSNEELDKIKEIGNTTVTTYQAIQAGLLNVAYFKSEHWAAEDKKWYRFIILDECHYFLSDSSFNNVTRLAFDEFVRGLQRPSRTLCKPPSCDRIETAWRFFRWRRVKSPRNRKRGGHNWANSRTQGMVLCVNGFCMIGRHAYLLMLSYIQTYQNPEIQGDSSSGYDFKMIALLIPVSLSSCLVDIPFFLSSFKYSFLFSGSYFFISIPLLIWHILNIISLASMNDCMSGEFSTLAPGTNAISWSGEVTSIVIRPNWRFL